MEQFFDAERLQAWRTAIETWLESHVFQWHVLWQFGAILLCLLLGWLAARLLKAPLAKAAGRLRLPGTKLSAGTFVERTFQRIAVILFLWIAVFVAGEVTWPSQSYLLRLVTNLATVWVVLSITTQLFRNPLVSRLVATALFIIVALNLLGLRSEVADALDSVSLTVGNFSITLLSVNQALVLLVLLLWATSLLSGLLDARLKASANLTPSLQVLISKLAKILLLTMAFLIAINSVGVDLTALAVLSGGIGVGVGFGLQKVVSNFISGLILLIDKSIKPGDVIEIEGTFGWITALRGRYVSVVTRNGTEYLIPNEDLITQRVINWSHSSNIVRQEITFGVAYESDPYLVRKLAREAAASVKRTLSEPAPVCHITGFGDSSIDFVLRFWIEDPKGGLANIKGDIFLALWDAFQENQISIPFPQRDVNLYDQGRRPEIPAPASSEEPA